MKRREIYFFKYHEGDSPYSRIIFTEEGGKTESPTFEGPLNEGLYKLIDYLAAHERDEVKIFDEVFCDYDLVRALGLLEQMHNRIRLGLEKKVETEEKPTSPE